MWSIKVVLALNSFCCLRWVFFVFTTVNGLSSADCAVVGIWVCWCEVWRWTSSFFHCQWDEQCGLCNSWYWSVLVWGMVLNKCIWEGWWIENLYRTS